MSRLCWLSTALALSLLTGCQSVPPRALGTDVSTPSDSPCATCADIDSTAKPHAVSQPGQPAKPTASTTAPSLRSTPPPPADPWLLLQSGLNPSTCDAPPVQQWQRRYLGRPERFSGRLSEFGPLLHFVSREVAARQLPQQFSLIPMVESSYYGFPGRGAGPAGMWQLMPAFPDLDALNAWLEERCKLLWAETAHGTLPGSIADVWEAEKPALMPLPTMFDGFVEERKRVSPTCLISFDRTRYSVPASFANRPVSLRIYPERLVVVAEGHVICTHERIIDRSHRQPGRVVYDWRHYLAVVQRKPGALRNGAPFVEMPEPFRMLQAKMLRQPGGDREMVDILSLVLHHDEQAVLCAVELALEAGVPTKTHVLNLLHRLLDGKPTDQPDVNPPAALSLSKEPEANVARYDGLRTQKGTRHAS